MAKCKVDPTRGTVTLEFSTPNALSITGGVCAIVKLDGSEIIPFEDRTSVSTIEWHVPPTVGSTYLLLARIPALPGIPQSQRTIKLSVLQGGTPVKAVNAQNPKTKKLRHKFPNGDFRNLDQIDLV